MSEDVCLEISQRPAIRTGSVGAGTYERIKQAKDTFAKIPRFDESYATWMAESKDGDVRDAISAGKAYEAIFEDLEELNEKLAKAQAKDAKITSPSKRAVAQERTLSGHLRKLEGLADKLDKLARKHGDTYYGRAARSSYFAFVDSEKKTLTDKRER